MNELLWFLFGCWVGATLMSGAFVIALIRDRIRFVEEPEQ